ncbi:SAF domain-containing protein [Pseudokineococcus sp. 1T1Z-3]|uniref:SAF domain-containing protein n=1 Tax=Pseudokineococcus sp. 1T1Z-3 TaxID=3132745 RepID=UPI0030B02286
MATSTQQAGIPQRGTQQAGTRQRRAEAGDAPRDRQRARTARGLRSAREAEASERLPAPPRERRPAMAALAVLLVVGGAAVAGLVALRADDRVAVLVAARDVAVGERLTEADLVERQVSAEGLDLVPAAGVASVVGTYAVQEIPAGRLLDTAMLNRQDPFAGGSVAVGVPVPGDRVPAQGLATGDVVQLVRVVDGTGEVLVDRARVSATSSGAQEGTTASGTPVATVLVDAVEAPEVAAAAAAGQLALVLVERAG